MPVRADSLPTDSIEATFEELYEEMILSESNPIDYIQAFNDLVATNSDPIQANQELTKLTFDLVSPWVLGN